MRHAVRGRPGVAFALLALAFVSVTAFGLHAARPALGRPAAGKLLIASPRLLDPNFARTVVLLTGYGPGGAMGIVINRPTEVSIGHAVPKLSEAPRAGDKIFVGGPVGRSRVFFLMRSDDTPEGAEAVFDDVYVSRNQDLLEKLIQDDESDTVFRVFVGYAGWGAGQLDRELERGDWLVKPADPDAVFFDGDERLWRHLLPPDPSWSAELETAGGERS